MKNLFFCMATLMALALGTPLQGQTTDKERLKANLERAFAPQPSSEMPEVSLPQDSRPDTSGVLYYVQVLASVRPIEGTGDRALRVFPDLKSVKEGRYLKYYTGAGTSPSRKYPLPPQHIEPRPACGASTTRAPSARSTSRGASTMCARESRHGS